MDRRTAFDKWLQSRHGIGAVFVPLILLGLLAYVFLTSGTPTPPPTVERPFEDFPLDVGARSAPPSKVESEIPPPVTGWPAAPPPTVDRETSQPPPDRPWQTDLPKSLPPGEEAPVELSTR